MACASEVALPADLRFAIAALSERFNACRLVSIADVRDELPRREVSRSEIESLIRSLADHGLCVLDGEAADLLGE